MEENQKCFRIGIAMAGAVSAGAYTAGVMDYLLEALENWQKAKDLGLPGVPQHEVLIEMLGGASAGGMTAVITAAAIQRNFPHINRDNYATAEQYKNPLYNAWVNLTETSKEDMMSQMLAPDDISDSSRINPGHEVRSVFNSVFIEKIAKRILDGTVKDPETTRPYFAQDLEVVTTLTNLRGFKYDLEFITASGKREDSMTVHKDLFHLQLNPQGQYKNDGKIPFHFETEEGCNKDSLIDAAIATGAFPVGLAPRSVTRKPEYINDNPLFRIDHSRKFVVDPSQTYQSVCVDGGVINNEPYDLAESILRNRRIAHQLQSGTPETSISEQLRKASEFDTTVLMIDPFPSEDPTQTDYLEFQAIKSTSPQLLGAMRQQLMVKSDLLERAYADEDYTRFMIAPIRSKNGTNQPFPIACGALGGFGGFFSKKFRVHDFMLGRRNCQRFIQHYFGVPVAAQNPLIEFGYGKLTPAEKERFLVKPGILPIIPDIRIAPDRKSIVTPPREDEFPFPTISLKYLSGLEKMVKERFELVIENIANSKSDTVKTPVNHLVEQLRRKSWFGRKIINPLGNIASKGILTVGKKSGSTIAAAKFIDLVIADMDKMGLVENDLF